MNGSVGVTTGRSVCPGNGGAGRVPSVRFKPLDEHGDPLEPLPPPLCLWCGDPVPPELRSDSRFCCREHTLKWHSRQQVIRLSAKRAAARAARANGAH
jgi:hypothetical protein